jgi:hypothetical protein
MSAAANAAAFLYIHRDKKLREWQDDVDLHRLAPSEASLPVPARGPLIRYRTRRATQPFANER